MVAAQYLAGLLVMLGALSLAPAAQAQQADGKAEQAEESVDCVSAGIVWSGNNDDIAHISTTAVPQSYRDLYLSDWCTRSALSTGSLITWHLAFGNEASTTKAIEFFEAQSGDKKPVVVDLGSRLASARRDAQHDIALAAAMFEQPDGSAPSQAILDKSEPVQRLLSVMAIWGNDSFLAAEYLRAAEFYGSPALFARARLYARPALGAAPIIKAITAEKVARNFGNASTLTPRNDVDLDDLEMHMAVVQASLSRDPKYLAAAKAMLDSHHNPFYEVADNEAFKHGDFCDVGKDPDLADYSKACENSDFPFKAIAWWEYRAQLDLLLDTDGDDFPSSVYTAIRLIERYNAQFSDDPHALHGFYNITADRIIALHLAGADALVRDARAKTDKPNEESRDTARQLLEDALEQLAEAEPLAPPSRMPGRFRQIATRFLAVRTRHAALEGRFHDPAIERKAAYFSTVLAALDDIAVGRAAKR